MKNLLIILLFLPFLAKGQIIRVDTVWSGPYPPPRIVTVYMTPTYPVTFIEFKKDSTSVSANETTVIKADTTGDFLIEMFANTPNPAQSAFTVTYTTIGGGWPILNASPMAHIKSTYSPFKMYLNKGDTFTVVTKGIAVHWRVTGRYEGP